jgi:Ca-activated chloride channel family protein
MKLLRGLFALTAIFAFSIVCFSQSEIKKDTEKSKREKSSEKLNKLVEVKANVLVWNAQGQPDDNIRQEDIKIYEDGIEQKLTYFAKKDNVLNIGLVVDNSGSMRTLLEEIIKAGTSFTNNLRAPDEAFIIRFVSTDILQVAHDWTSDQQKLTIAMNNLFIEGGPTDVIGAVYASINEKLLNRAKQNPAKRHAIILISDCENRESLHSLEEIIALTKDTDIQIFVLALTQDLGNGRNLITKVKDSRKNAENLANVLALETGGTVIFPKFDKNNNSPLTDAAKIIANELRSQYIVGYTSTNQNRNGKSRKLTVQIAEGASREKRRGFIREGFVVPKN